MGGTLSDISEIRRLVPEKAEAERIRYAPEVETEPIKAIWDNPLNLPDLLHETPEPIAWFIKDHLVAGRGAVVSGIGGSSKTRLLSHLAVGAVLGRLPWGWEVSRTGRAVLVLTEDTRQEWFRTIHNICVHSLSLSMEDRRRVYNGIIAYPLAGEDCILLEKKTKGIIETSALFDGLVSKIQELGDVVFVGLDPALSLTDGDELDQGHQRRLGKMCDNLGVLTAAAVLLAAHAPKALKNEITSHNSRGGGALVDAVRTELVMRTMTRDEATKAHLAPDERHKYVQLLATKGNFIPSGSYRPVWLQRDEYGNLSAADISFDNESDAPCSNDLKALEVLASLSKNGAEPRLQEWKAALIEIGIIGKGSDEARKKWMDRIKDRLKGAGLIQSPKRGYWLPDDRDADERMFDFNA